MIENDPDAVSIVSENIEFVKNKIKTIGNGKGKGHGEK